MVSSFRRDPSVTEKRLPPGTVKRIVRFAAPYRRQLIAFLGLVVVDAVIGAAIPWIYGDIVTAIQKHSRGLVVGLAVGLAVLAVVDAAVNLANSYAPEHLELLETDAALMAERVTTAGCVFVGRHGATAFGDYVVGSNHVLPTGGAGRYAGPLGPGSFRRRISNVELDGGSAAELALHVDALADAEGFPVHGESAMIRRR
jgi:histidinol dehydrogenase